MRFQFLAVATPGSLAGRIKHYELHFKGWPGLTVNVTIAFLEES